MKIYPGTHNIIATKEVNKDTDIPIAYVTNQETKTDVTVSSYYNKDENRSLIPYETFNTRDIILFNSQSERIADTYNYIIHNGNGVYQYVPKDIITSIKPDEFSYRIIAQRNEVYNNLKNYYLNIRCLNDKFDDSDETSLIDTIRSIFLFAADRKLCPNAITFNENDQDKFIYDEDIDTDIDFCFIKSSDGLTVEGANITELSPLLNTNLWVIVKDDSFPNANNVYPLFNYDGKSYDYSINSSLYDSITYNSDLKLFIYQRFKEDVDSDIFTMSTTSYAPLYIKEDKINHRFLIYSPESLFNDLTTDSVNLIIEYVMQIYLMSYFKSKYYTSWIADEMPDYVISNHSMIKQLSFTSSNTYNNLIGSKKDDIILSSVEISNSNIAYTINTSDYIVFKKIRNSEQFTRPSDCISVYCPNKTIIYYKDNVFLKKTNLLNCIDYSYENNTFTIRIKNYIDSYENVYVTDETIEEELLDDVDKMYLISTNNILELVGEEELYDSSSVSTPIATFTFNKKLNNERQVYDIRQRGGGLPKNVQHDYQSILDIGAMNGITYRRGGTLIIKLPLEFKKYDSRIKEAIKKHIAADAYSFVVYY